MEELQTAKTSENEGSIADTTKEVNDVVFEDGASSDVEVKEESKSTSVYDGKTEKKPQSKEQNSEFARKRREEQRKNEDSQLRVKTIIETLDGVNPYTNKEMKDSRDVEEYLLMKQIDKDGGDPRADYSEYLKKSDRKREKELEETTRQNDWFNRDRENFIEKYPEVDLSKLINDEGFQSYADGKVGVKSLGEIYEGYIKIASNYQSSINKKAAQMVANQTSSVGSLSGTGVAEEGFFSQEQVNKMSKEQIAKNYENIRKSMSKW